MHLRKYMMRALYKETGQGYSAHWQKKTLLKYLQKVDLNHASRNIQL